MPIVNRFIRSFSSSQKTKTVLRRATPSSQVNNMMQESERSDSYKDESEQKMTPEEMQKKEELEAELAKVR